MLLLPSVGSPAHSPVRNDVFLMLIPPLQRIVKIDATLSLPQCRIQGCDPFSTDHLLLRSTWLAVGDESVWPTNLTLNVAHATSLLLLVHRDTDHGTATAPSMCRSDLLHKEARPLTAK